MASKKHSRPPRDEANEILNDLLIVQLGLGGVPRPQIRKIVGCDIHRVNKIVRHLKLKDERTARKRR